jgi:hypothetical protein
MKDNDGMLESLETEVLNAADAFIGVRSYHSTTTMGQERLAKAVFALRRFRRQLNIVCRRKNRKEED